MADELQDPHLEGQGLDEPAGPVLDAVGVAVDEARDEHALGTVLLDGAGRAVGVQREGPAGRHALEDAVVD